MVSETINSQDNNDYNSRGDFSDNRGYNGATALQIRLDSSKVISEIEQYLKGYREEQFQDENGIFRTRLAWKGKPMLNDEGVQGVMATIIAVFNNQVVQGNWLDYDMYAEFLCRTRKELAFNLMANMYKYDLDLKRYASIMSTIMRYIEVYMTRPINNKERESYSQTMRSSEIMQVQNRPQQTTGVSGFFKKIF